MGLNFLNIIPTLGQTFYKFFADVLTDLFNGIYNQKINVFIENTGRLISENLVDLNTLIAKLSKYKIKLIETQTFEKTFKDRKELIHNIPENKRTTQQIREKTTLDNLDPDENLKRFSFLNRWCIFEKTLDQ